MESRSQISSRSSKNFQQNKIPSIHIQQFILDEHAKKLSSLPSSNISRVKHPQIFTVAQTLKDPLILNHIRPDYGSLAQFVGHINIGRDLLNQKKRKNDATQEETEEKKIKHIFKQKTKQQLNTIFLDKSSSALQKKVVGKMIVQNLFKQSFGMSLNAFENQNIPNPQPKNYKIDLSNIEQIFNGKRPQSKKTQSRNDKKLTRLQNSKQQQQLLRLKNKDNQISTDRQKIQILQQIKSKYVTLRKVEFQKQCQEFNKLRLIKSQQQSQIIINSKYLQQKIQKQKPTHVFELTQNNIIFEKLTLKTQLIFYLLSQVQIDQISSITLNQVRINEQLLCFMLQVVKNICPKLNKLVLRCISLERTENLAMKIKQMLQVMSLKQLILEYIDFETKQFCQICLGIGANTTLETFSFDNNSIDERACKSLELISKHCLNLKKISLRKNYLQPHHFSYFTPEAKAKIII